MAKIGLKYIVYSPLTETDDAYPMVQTRSG